MSPLEFIQHKKERVLREIENLRPKVHVLERELADMESAERVVAQYEAQQLSDAEQRPPSPPRVSGWIEEPVKRRSQRTESGNDSSADITETVYKIVAESDDSLSKSQIIRAAKDLYGSDGRKVGAAVNRLAKAERLVAMPDGTFVVPSADAHRGESEEQHEYAAAGSDE